MSNEMQDWLRDNAVDALQARIAELEAVLKATVPKLNRMIRMPNTEWVADEHNAAVEKLRALLGGGEK